MLDTAPLLSMRFSTLDDAWLYCSTLEHNGFSDWRLPTWSEGADFDRPFMFWHSDWNRINKVGYHALPVRDKDD